MNTELAYLLERLDDQPTSNTTHEPLTRKILARLIRESFAQSEADEKQIEGSFDPHWD